jgi:nitric oxide dioxygenase
MLTPKTIALVQATVPFLRVRGEEITQHFYGKMLVEHPELRTYFNEAHQAHGTQARALATAVLAYASHLDKLEALAPALPRIVQKHASLGVQPEHYPIVGKCLLAAIKYVLKEDATDEIISAWEAAYRSLANLFIEAEEAVYANTEARIGGWRGVRALRVLDRVRESDTITSFYFGSVDGGALTTFSAGQYLTIVVNIEGKSLRRNYSLSDSPHHPWYRISVKREPNGVVSNWLHDKVGIGAEVFAQPPAGDFTVDQGSLRPLFLVTGGVGITPAMSMLEANAPSGRQIRFLHATRHSGEHAFRERVNHLAETYNNVKRFYVYEEPRPGDCPDAVGRIDRDLLARFVGGDSDVDLYFLGPKPFMSAIYAHGRAIGVPESQLRYEFFGPSENLHYLSD